MLHKILENNTVAVLLFAAMLILISVVVLNGIWQSTMDHLEWQEQVYRVETGDTLWGIASSYCPDSVDRREWIREIHALNGLDDENIYPGQALIVLAVKEG